METGTSASWGRMNWKNAMSTLASGSPRRWCQNTHSTQTVLVRKTSDESAVPIQLVTGLCCPMINCSTLIFCRFSGSVKPATAPMPR